MSQKVSKEDHQKSVDIPGSAEPQAVNRQLTDIWKLPSVERIIAPDVNVSKLTLHEQLARRVLLDRLNEKKKPTIIINFEQQREAMYDIIVNSTSREEVASALGCVIDETDLLAYGLDKLKDMFLAIRRHWINPDFFARWICALLEVRLLKKRTHAHTDVHIHLGSNPSDYSLIKDTFPQPRVAFLVTGLSLCQSSHRSSGSSKEADCRADDFESTYGEIYVVAALLT